MASIKKRPDGKWRARYRDDAGREHARHFDRKVDAQRWLDEVAAAFVTGTYVDPRAGRITLSSFYADWADRQVWETGTRRSSNLAMRGCTFADLPLSRVRRSHAEAWIKSLSSTLAPSTVSTRVNYVRAVLQAAVADRVIAVDPTAGVNLPRRRRPEAAMVIPTPEDVASLIDGARAPYSAYVALAAFAGLRQGELSGVQVGDVDFLRGQLTVTRQVQVEGNEIEVRPPKYGSERVLFLPRELVDLLAAHVAEHRPGDDPTRWMFVDRKGWPLSHNAAGYQWRLACRQADAARQLAAERGAQADAERTGRKPVVPQIPSLSRFTLHDLRHFFASGLIAAGCDVVTVQRALGHASATTTLNTYAHLWPSAEDRTRAAAAGIMAATRGGADSPRTAAPPTSL